MDLDALIANLSLEEKAALTSGAGMLNTVAIDHLNLPEVWVTDGPNGARGLAFPGLGGERAICIPCGAALGGSWDPKLVERLGSLLGAECRARGFRGLLAPTVNLHRHPLAGRNFECYSEDPILSGQIATGYVKGVQSEGVFCTIKHFVGNDAEFERRSMNSVIDERTLRELYLVPFEFAVRDANVGAVMTGYNRLNGRWLTEQPEMLTNLLRDEWGFDGLVMTDWFAVVSTEHSLGAGLDLEMPGPARAFGSKLLDAIKDGRVPVEHLDAAVSRLLSGLNRFGGLEEPHVASHVVPPGKDVRALLTEAAASSSVLLTNDGLLPLIPQATTTIALIGDHAVQPRFQGGGSAGVIPFKVASPLVELQRVLGASATITLERGCEVDRLPAVLGSSVMSAPQGIHAEFYQGQEFLGEPIMERHFDDLRILSIPLMDDTAFPRGEWSMRAQGTVVPRESGAFQFSLAQIGSARVFFDNELVLDGFTEPPPPGGKDFFGMISQDLVIEREVTEGVAIEVMAEFIGSDAMMCGLRVGSRSSDEEAVLRRAVASAAAAEVAIVFVGTSPEWESEGFDRESFELPGRQRELIDRVAAVNDRTIVVINAGAPVDIGFADQVSAVLWVWFGGEEMASAVAEIIAGMAEPGGRLPTTFPEELAHSPSFANFPGENGELRYGEGLFMGYRGFEHSHRAPRFAFGSGLSYTTFEIDSPAESMLTFEPGGSLSVTVPITNVGSRAGSEVVQLYVAATEPRLVRPRKELKAFEKVWLEPGETTEVRFELDDRSFAYWDPGQRDLEDIQRRFGESAVSNALSMGFDAERRPRGWQVDPGRYELHIGRASNDIAVVCEVEIRGSTTREDAP